MNGDEDVLLVIFFDFVVEEMGKNFQNYGGFKVVCEVVVEVVLLGCMVVVCLGYIVGFDDLIGCFIYWLVCFDKGGEVVVFGVLIDLLQFIDVCDLVVWLVLLVENCFMGKFNVLGFDKFMVWGCVIMVCQKVMFMVSSIIWVFGEFVVKQLDIDFLIWVLYVGEIWGFYIWQNQCVVWVGLCFRFVEQMVVDMLVWYYGQLREEKGCIWFVFMLEQEVEVLKCWRVVVIVG